MYFVRDAAVTRRGGMFAPRPVIVWLWESVVREARNAALLVTDSLGFKLTQKQLGGAPMASVLTKSPWSPSSTHGPWHGKRSIGVLTAVTALHCSHSHTANQTEPTRGLMTA